MAQSIKDRVAIIGMGCTKFGELWDKSVSDLMVDAAYEAFEDANIEPKDVDAAWVGNWQEVSGMAGLGLSGLRLQYKPITRVENMCCTGTDALRNAAYAVASGVVDVGLAVGAEKLKDMGFAGLVSVSPGGTTATAGLTTTAPALFAMLATRYFDRYNISPDDGKRMLSHVSIKSHHNGNMNPKAHFHRELTMEQAMNAPIIAWPLGLFDCCGVSDGAGAAIVVRAEDAKKYTKDYINIKGIQMCVGPAEGPVKPEYDFTHTEETTRAGINAYKEAGIKNPRKEIDMAEVHDCFSITEAIVMEDLQFSKRGGMKEDIESGFFDLDGGLPVQPDGGLKCFGHPVGATGLRMIYEMYLQLLGRAGKRQIKDPKIGLTHNLGSMPCACTIAVSVLGLP
ncbi:MAG: acetyl-CoA acetyltransferase [Chloroflexota bacterium]|nr:acetyl-CoA acetyltransferase [Chloroflexota bacterium]